MLDGFQLIDVHLHAASKTSLKLSWDTWVQGFADRDVMDRLYDPSGAVIPEAFDALLAAEGVDTGLLMCEYSPKVTGLQVIEDMLPIAAANPERIKVIANVNPHYHYPVDEEVRRQLALGAVALKIHPVHAGAAANDRMLYPAYEACQAAGVPVVVHCGTSTFPGASNAFGDPVALDDVLRDFRSLTLVLAHGGRGWWYDAAAFLALSHERVWIELSGLPPSRLRDYYARQNWTRLAKRMIFGTDWPGIPGIAANARAVARLMPDEDTAAAVLAGNAVRVYNLKPTVLPALVTPAGSRAPTADTVVHMTGSIGVVGAGTMGAGIAQVAAVAGRPVRIADAVPGAAERAVTAIRDRVKAQVAKGRLSVDADALDLIAVDGADGLTDCEVVIEAIVEDLDVKRALFAELETVVASDAILASNTSSLSPTAIAAGLAHPERLVGLHFFNPVPAMRLVEVISGLATAPSVADAAADLATAWGKTVVRSTATPGFIVNRIARPFYAEAWRLHEEHAAAPQHIDAVLTGAGGFRMGPFALMDLIGHDVNEAVTRSVWSAFGYDPRFAPSLAQRALVEAGWLGRKTGRGVYPADDDPRFAPAPAPAAGAPRVVVEHAGHAADGDREPSPLRALLDRAGVGTVSGDRDDTGAGLPDGLVELPSGALLAQCEGVTATSLSAAFERPVIVVDRVLDPATAAAIAIAPSDGCPPVALTEATGLLQAAGLDVYVIDDTPGLIVTRTVAMLANLAADALACRVASEPDIDAAMRLGVNYPLGPLAWARRWGIGTVLRVLDSLEDWYRDGHYRASPLLRRTALAQRGPAAGPVLPRQGETR